MPNNKDRYIQKDFSGGVQNKTNENLRSYNNVLHALNADFDEILGGIVGRKGSEKQSTVAAYRIRNLFVYKYGATKKYIAVLDNTTNMVLYANASANFGGSWGSAVKSLTTGEEVYFENFIGKMFYFNGVDSPESWDGSTFSAVTNAPAAGKFPFVLNQRLYVLTEAGYLWYSDVVGSDGISFTSDTWTNRGINPNDGQVCKFAIRHRGRGVLFKEESIYRYDGTNEPEAVITVGTHSGRSVVILVNLYFHHPTGIYEMGAGEPVKISRPVERYLRNMDSANWENVASVRDDDSVYFWIGDVTINDHWAHDYGNTYSNVVLKFNTRTRTWTVYSGWDLRQGYFDDITGDAYFGDSDGKILKINTGYADVDGATTTPINMEVVFFPEHFDYPELQKRVEKVVIAGRLQGKASAAKSYGDLYGENEVGANMESGICEITGDIVGREIWTAYNERYVDTPPYISQIIYDKVDVYDEAN